jgi:hypothetical protein
VQPGSTQLFNNACSSSKRESGLNRKVTKVTSRNHQM